MSLRRWAAAALVLLLAFYLKLTMPVFAERCVPALQDMLRCEQLECVIPVEAASCPVLD